MSLIWKLFFATAATFAVFLIVLATSPATVSDPIDPVELAELLGAFALLLVVQWWIVRGLLRPLGALSAGWTPSTRPAPTPTPRWPAPARCGGWRRPTTR